MAITHWGRRYETRFRCYGAVIDSTNNVRLAQAMTNWSKPNSDSESSTAIGVPSSGTAFLRSHWFCIENDYWYFVGDLNPPTSKSWTDPSWNRKTQGVTWYSGEDENKGEILGDRATASGMYSKTIGTYKYFYGLGFFHPVNIENKSRKSVSLKFRVLHKFFVYDGVFKLLMGDWLTRSVDSGDTMTLTGVEPIEIKFESKAIGGPVGNEHAYSVTDQYGWTRRMEKDSADYILKTEDGSIIDTPILDGLLNNDDGPIIIDDYIEDVWTEGEHLIHGDISTGAGKLLHGTIGAGENLLLYEAVVTEEDTDSARSARSAISARSARSAISARSARSARSAGSSSRLCDDNYFVGQ